jgi:2-polyprenyl-3-methyl-5-hydroxy-6-metoxy-1,4-benzoquinol methylase
MNLLYYLKYFYFIGSNWNIRLAAFTLYHEIKGEKKYHTNTLKINRLHNLSIRGENLKHASIYQAVNYFILEKAFNFFKGDVADKSFVDFGCGKGRVMIVAAHYGFKSITGIEFATELCNEAERNITLIKNNFPSSTFQIACIDAVKYKIKAEENVFFFFNPFDEVVMLQVVKNLLNSLKETPRKVHILYVNPLHKDLFLSAGFREVFYFKKMTYIELSILSND